MKQINLLVCGKVGAGKSSLIEGLKQFVELNDGPQINYTEVELESGQASMEYILRVSQKIKASSPDIALKWILVIAASDRALEIESRFLAEGRLKGALVVLTQIDMMKPLREWDATTFSIDVPESKKARNIRDFASFLKRTLSISSKELLLCSFPEGEDNFGVASLWSSIWESPVLREKTNDELQARRGVEHDLPDETSWNPLTNAAHSGIKAASTHLTEEVIPELDRTLRLKTLRALDSVLENFLQELRVQLNLLLEGQMKSTSQLVNQVQELTGQVHNLLDGLGPNAEKVTGQFRLLSADASEVVQQVKQISDNIGSHLDTIEPLAQSLTNNIHEAAVPLSSLASTLESIASRIQTLMPPSDAEDKPSSIDKVSSLLEKHGTLLEELVQVGDRYIAMEEKKRRFGSEAAMEKMVLLLGSGIFFMTLSRFFSDSPTNAFTLLRVGWGAIAVTGFFTFGKPLWKILQAVRRDKETRKVIADTLPALFWKKLQSEEMVGYVVYLVFILLISGLTFVGS